MAERSTKGRARQTYTKTLLRARRLTHTSISGVDVPTADVSCLYLASLVQDRSQLFSSGDLAERGGGAKAGAGCVLQRCRSLALFSFVGGRVDLNRVAPFSPLQGRDARLSSLGATRLSAATTSVKVGLKSSVECRIWKGKGTYGLVRWCCRQSVSVRSTKIKFGNWQVRRGGRERATRAELS